MPFYPTNLSNIVGGQIAIVQPIVDSTYTVKRGDIGTYLQFSATPSCVVTLDTTTLPNNSLFVLSAVSSSTVTLTAPGGSINGVATIFPRSTVLVWLSNTQFIILPWRNAATPTLLASVPGVDLNTTTKTALYTVVNGKPVIITDVIIREASTSITTAQAGVGFDASGVNVVASQSLSDIVDDNGYIKLPILVGASIGTSLSVLGVKPTVPQGAPCTATYDVYGYFPPS